MSRKPKVVRTNRELEVPGVDQALLDSGVELLLLPDDVDEDRLGHESRDADLILMCYTPITADVIARAKQLKGIVKFGVGIDAIDIDAARARDIPVVNVPEYAEQTVAEGAAMLMMALAKKLLPISAAMKHEGWVWPASRWLGADIAGQTLGLVGVGRIGRAMARIAGAGFRANVVGYDPGMSAEAMAGAGVEKRDDLTEMLKHCDFVSVHCVLNEETRYLIGRAELAAMKPSAFLINVSRGAIVDEAALLDALRLGEIGGAGLDVFGREPLSMENHPLSALYYMENVILTPHLAFYTREAMLRLEADTLARCFEILEGQPVLVKSTDRRLTAQTGKVVFGQ